MEAFLARPKRKASSEPCVAENEDSTEIKLALLASLHPEVDQDALLDVLLAHEGSVSETSDSLNLKRVNKKVSSRKFTGGAIGVGHQLSLKQYALPKDDDGGQSPKRLKTRRGATLHLYDPEDVAENTPCTIIHNFLPAEDADALLRELLKEAESFEKITFRLFENVVSSPHTSSFFVESFDEIQRQKTQYHYNGGSLTDVRRITPQLIKVKPMVQEAVNKEIETRIKTQYPGGKKLRFQSPKPWAPNSAFVNCYKGAQESVGWHSDQLTYLGPRAVIGSISLGVTREFRVRRVLPKDNDQLPDASDATGQISIHLPHNSLLVMHADMQEEWKHCIVPALSIDPHPIAGNTRINITYRNYRSNMHPRYTPKCHCQRQCVLRVVQRKKESFGKYFWMCYTGNDVDKKNGCAFFKWAEFDDDGNPLWKGGSSRT